MVFIPGFYLTVCCIRNWNMAEDKRQLFKALGFLSSLGISIVAASVIGLAMGFYLDKWLGTSPWLTLIFLGFGIIAGFRNIYVLTTRELKRQADEERENGGNGNGPG